MASRLDARSCGVSVLSTGLDGGGSGVGARRGATAGMTGISSLSTLYVAKTSSGGTFSPSCCMTFAIFLRRISGIAFARNRNDGVRGVGVAIDDAPELLLWRRGVTFVEAESGVRGAWILAGDASLDGGKRGSLAATGTVLTCRISGGGVPARRVRREEKPFVSRREVAESTEFSDSCDASDVVEKFEPRGMLNKEP